MRSPASIAIGWIFLFGAMTAHADACADLKSLHLDHTAVTASELVPEAVDTGTDGAPAQTVPEHCKVTGTIAPSIEFELWLPVKNWNGNWQAVGTGGFGGTINTLGLGTALRAGYATAANNSGHRQDDPSWMSSKSLIRLWGHESIHLMVQPVQALIQKFYGKPHQKAYFSGCSTGGDQAMEEAEYYPRDFDGIVAISPGMAYSHLMLSFLWGKKVSEQYPDSKLSPAKLQLLHRAALARCDKLDGVEDGLLEDPRHCDFDVASLRCPATDGPDCLTAHQVETVRQLMTGPHNPRTGAEIYPGFYFGSEASPEYADAAALNRFGWTLIQGPLADRYAIPVLATMVFANPHWDPTTFDFDSSVRQVDAALEGVITAMDPDLRPYARHGGKLIMIQGWSDPLNPPTLPIEYWEKVNKVFASAAAGRKVDDFYRLFMAPGMGHCALGPGPNEFDAVAALDQWVTTHEPPTHLIATKHLKDDPRAAVLMTRPLCSYPAHAVWNGKGDPHNAQSFTCVTPQSPCPRLASQLLADDHGSAPEARQQPFSNAPFISHMLALLAILTILVVLAVILLDLASPIVALVTVPVVGALLGGFGLQTSKFVIAGITSLAPIIAMFIFSILYFGLMTDAGLLKPLVRYLVRSVGNRPSRVVLASAALALLVHLDGSGAVCFIVVIPTFLPLYDALGMDRRVLACVSSLAAGVNFLPWTGPTLRASAALHIPVMDIFRPLLPVQLIGLVFVFGVAAWLGRREDRRVGAQPPAPQPSKLEDEPTQATTPARFFLNATLTIVVLGTMIAGWVDPAVAFLTGTVVALIINFPRSSDQRARIESHARAAILMASTLIAAGAFTGIMTGSGMLKALSQAAVSHLPPGAGAHLPLIVGLIAMPLSLLLDPDSYYFGVMPVLAEVTRSVGGLPINIAQASLLGMMTTGFPISPLTPATFLVTGLSGVDLAAHQKFTGPFLFAASILMCVSAVLFGILPL